MDSAEAAEIVANAIITQKLKLKLTKINNGVDTSDNIISIIQAYDDVTFIMYDEKWYILDDMMKKYEGFFDIIDEKRADINPFEKHIFKRGGVEHTEENAVRLSGKVITMFNAWNTLKEENLL